MLTGYLVHSHRYSGSDTTSRFWDLQSPIVAQLRIIRALSIVVAFVHPDHNNRAVSNSFAKNLTANGWLVDGGPSRDLLQISGLGPHGGMAIALLAVLIGVYFFFKTHQHRWGLALGSIVAGLSIALGWGLTQAIASQSFEAVQIQGLSFSSASAEMLMRTLSSNTSPSWGFDAGLLPATFVGSLLGALVGGDFKFEGFKTENKLGHYLTGAVLMGFGAVLAGGCTVGAGMTGGSLFSLTAWLTLIAIWLGAGLSWRIHRQMGWQI